MPFYIDRFRGSLHVQGMPAAAKLGYLFLLAAQWQSEDGGLPNDDFELQILSGLTQEEWTRLGVLILRRFPKREDGLLANRVLTTILTETKQRWERQKEAQEDIRRKRSEAGKAGAKMRHGKANAGTSQDEPSEPVASVTETVASATEALASAEQTLASAQAKPSFKRREQDSTGKDLKPSRVSAASDPRHVLFRHVCKDYAAFKEVSFVWDGSEAKALDLLLKAAPDLTVDAFKRCIWHRAKSAGVTHGDRPRLWLPNITKYQQGPLNEFGKTGGSNGIGTSKTDSSLDAAQRAIQRLLGGEEGGHCAPVGEIGSAPSGEVGGGRLLDSGR